VVDVETRDDTVLVTFTATVALPFVNHISERWVDGYPLTVTARARSPLRVP